MKRSNRIVLVLGIVLAAAAFAATIVVLGQRQPPPSTEPTALPTVYARTNIPLGTTITADMVEARPLDISVRPADAIGDVGLVIGKVVRTDVAQGQQITQAVFSGAIGGGTDVARLLEPGLRAIAIEVDQTSGVGTLISVGDRVDAVVGFTGVEKFPLILPNPEGVLVAAPPYNPTTTKLLLQNMQVIGTLLPPAAAATATSGVPFTGDQQLVILAVTAQQAEVIKFAQIDGLITLVLRSPRDFQDASGVAIAPLQDVTTGIVLRTLIEDYGVLPPSLIQTTVPEP